MDMYYINKKYTFEYLFPTLAIMLKGHRGPIFVMLQFLRLL